VVKDEIRAALQPFVGREICGASWAVRRREDTFVGAVGHRRVAPSHPASPDTLWDAASLTKPLVTAALAVSAAEEGWADLDRSAGAQLRPADSRLATPPRDWLTHRAGLPAWEPVYAWSGNADKALDILVERWGAGGSEPPGTYSCLSYLLLGHWLARAAERPLRALAEQHLARLGLRNLSYWGRMPPGRAPGAESPPTAEEDLARPFGAIPPPPAPGLPHDGNARFLLGRAGNAGLFCTAAAALKLLAFWEERPRRWEREGRFAPCGLHGTEGTHAESLLGKGALMHLGYTGTAVYWSPEEGFAAVLLANRVHPRMRTHDLEQVRRAFLEAARA